ncbi:uncharacterized protein BJ212DRAFT_1385679 [Suillus subaureus]|uniref:Uncharacterized protein n=1 Tax=Suillus subaureus TaxID=48587 RepID=A0A9P7E126_9AGAM|nr:uncharacterized protein BJ212DRAFT_1385679 [Suillus subaureus]KAG1807830.1 hypothetical protein BJ212DRAFT_1385679 [Suillus subaureus]
MSTFACSSTVMFVCSLADVVLVSILISLLQHWIAESRGPELRISHVPSLRTLPSAPVLAFCRPRDESRSTCTTFPCRLLPVRIWLGKNDKAVVGALVFGFLLFTRCAPNLLKEVISSSLKRSSSSSLESGSCLHPTPANTIPLSSSSLEFSRELRVRGELVSGEPEAKLAALKW